MVLLALTLALLSVEATATAAAAAATAATIKTATALGSKHSAGELLQQGVRCVIMRVLHQVTKRAQAAELMCVHTDFLSWPEVII
jgi:hypothetical protein